MPKICIDPGHGGTDSGALLNTRYEKNDTLKMALKVKELLEAQGVTVVLTRNADKYLTLSDRCSIANKNNVDYFLSIHRNSLNATSKGIEIWVYSKATDATTKKAQGILDSLVKVGGTNRGVKKGYTGNPNVDYAINRESTMPSALLELLFISNPDDNKLFDDHFDEYAEAIAKGLCSAVGVTYKTSSTSAKNTTALEKENQQLKQELNAIIKDLQNLITKYS